MSVTSCLDFKSSLDRNASFKFHSFDHAVEVNSHLLTITNTSQISLGGGGGGPSPPSPPRSYVPGLNVSVDKQWFPSTFRNQRQEKFKPAIDLNNIYF